MTTKTKKIQIGKHDIPSVSGMLENIIGCKWSLSVLELIRGGVTRPGAMQRAMDGLSTKVLNERLRKLQRYGILDKTVFPVTPPRVEYQLTPFGSQFSVLLDDVKKLQGRLEKKEKLRSS
jgi:DNA-binding HxlR family transcriptional regulator